tara:strand:- start:3191 stop:3526 length:336 start_codon:yes stop_codon:yes gene_type:complete
MAIIRLIFENPINTSTQVGDRIYAISPGNDTVNNDNFVGVVHKIPNNLEIRVDDSNGVNNVSVDDFIMFQKDNKSNVTSLNGYYANVKMENSSTEKVELFSLASEVSQSSK